MDSLPASAPTLCNWIAVLAITCEGGANEVAIMQTTGHKSSAMVRRYVRRVEAFRNNAASAAGL